MLNSEIAEGLKVELVGSCYEITGHDPAIGPYDLKKDAESDMRGVRRFYHSLPDDVFTLTDIIGD